MKKKILFLVLSLCLALGLCACDAPKNPTPTDPSILFSASSADKNLAPAFVAWDGAVTAADDGTIAVSPSSLTSGEVAAGAIPSGAMTLFGKTQETKNDKNYAAGGFTATASFYIDTAWQNGLAFTWTVAINNSTSGTYLNETFVKFEKFADGVRIKAQGDNVIDLSTTQNKITASGYYTVNVKYYEKNSLLFSEASVYTPDGEQVYTLSDIPAINNSADSATPGTAQATAADAGAIRYGWIFRTTVPKLNLNFAALVKNL